MEIRSIWDGWVKQCFGRLYDDTGGNCANGFLTDVALPHDFGLRMRIRRRVATWIRSHYDIPAIYHHPIEGEDYYPQDNDAQCIVYANNELKLTPEDFRRIDRETQLEAITKPLIESVEESLTRV